MSGTTVVASAPAKINLCLGVGARRDDGFHPLATVYQAIGIYDHVTAAPASELSVEVVTARALSIADVPQDASNLAARAAILLAEHHGLEPTVSLRVDKEIPVSGGMAGGSADAAASLVACDHLWDTHTPREDLLALAARLGSDVPFALLGGTAVGSGRGEVVAPLLARGEYWWVVLESAEGLSTPRVYDAFDAGHDAVPAGPPPEVPVDLVRALLAADVDGLGAALGNDLQAAAVTLRPELAAALELGVVESAVGAVVSGSGPTCLFLCRGRAHAVHVAGALQAAGHGPVSFAAGPVPGARVVVADG